MSQLRVLLIDQSAEFMEVVSEWLMVDPSFQVIGTTQRGREGLTRVARERPDVVLVDVTLPDLNGFQMARRIKDLADPPLVLLVAFHDSETARREARAAGADDLIAKSEVTAGFKEMVMKLMSQRSLRSLGSTAEASSEVQVRRSTKGPRKDLS